MVIALKRIRERCVDIEYKKVLTQRIGKLHTRKIQLENGCITPKR